MVKKLLILSLVAVMLSTAAFANGILLAEATYAAEPEEITETFGSSKINILLVKPESGEQKISAVNWSSTSNSDSTSVNTWMLIRVEVGENWNFSALTLTMRLQMNKGFNDAFVAPLSKSDYDAAVAAAAAGTRMTTLVRPADNPLATKTELEGSGKATPSTLWVTSTSMQNRSASLNVANFTNAHYNGEYLYLAAQVLRDSVTTDTTNKVATSERDYEYNGSLKMYFSEQKGATSWKLTVKGTKVEAPAVDDFSDAEIEYDNTTGVYTIATATTTDEAYLIIASFTGATMIDVKLVPINAATASRNDDGAISGTITPLKEGTIKIFLWDKETLAPATTVQ